MIPTTLSMGQFWAEPDHLADAQIQTVIRRSDADVVGNDFLVGPDGVGVETSILRGIVPCRRDSCGAVRCGSVRGSRIELVIRGQVGASGDVVCVSRSEEHTSELQSRQYLVCRLLLEKKKKTRRTQQHASMVTQQLHTTT